MTAAPVHMAGERLMLDPRGAMFWPARRLLAVSDLHLEKGSSFARKGMLLPPWDTQTTLDRLALLLRHWRPLTNRLPRSSKRVLVLRRWPMLAALFFWLQVCLQT